MSDIETFTPLLVFLQKKKHLKNKYLIFRYKSQKSTFGINLNNL